MALNKARQLRVAALGTPTDLSPEAVKEIAGALNVLLADIFALYLKTKNFHWHVSGPHYRDYHLLLDEHADQIAQTSTSPIASSPIGFCGNGVGHVQQKPEIWKKLHRVARCHCHDVTGV